MTLFGETSDEVVDSGGGAGGDTACLAGILLVGSLLELVVVEEGVREKG